MSPTVKEGSELVAMPSLTVGLLHRFLRLQYDPLKSTALHNHQSLSMTPQPPV